MAGVDPTLKSGVCFLWAPTWLSGPLNWVEKHQAGIMFASKNWGLDVFESNALSTPMNSPAPTSPTPTTQNNNPQGHKWIFFPELHSGHIQLNQLNAIEASPVQNAIRATDPWTPLSQSRCRRGRLPPPPQSHGGLAWLSEGHADLHGQAHCRPNCLHFKHWNGTFGQNMQKNQTMRVTNPRSQSFA